MVLTEAGSCRHRSDCKNETERGKEEQTDLTKDDEKREQHTKAISHLLLLLAVLSSASTAARINKSDHLIKDSMRLQAESTHATVIIFMRRRRWMRFCVLLLLPLRAASDNIFVVFLKDVQVEK